jgi:hypothetical protein
LEVVQKRYKEHLEATPLGRLAMTYTEEPEEKPQNMPRLEQSLQRCC